MSAGTAFRDCSLLCETRCFADDVECGPFLFGFGVFSMGFQLLGSRLLGPWFGSSIVVWAFLISTFLAAFSAGSITGGITARKRLAQRSRWLTVILGITLVGFFLTALMGRPFLAWLDARLWNIPASLALANLLLFFLPVCGLAAITPLLVQRLSEAGNDGGFASGFLYGASTIGNIAGIMVTAFFLIPALPLSALLWVWFGAVAFLSIALRQWIGRPAV